MGFQDITFDADSVFLVGGGAGFIGSNICEALIHMGYTVRCLDDLSTGKYENIEPLVGNERFTFIKGDIRDLDTCMAACQGADYVLNQAAWGSVPRSIEMPLLYEEINIRGTLNMMEAARVNGVKKVRICFQFFCIRQYADPAQEGRTGGEGDLSIRADETGR